MSEELLLMPVGVGGELSPETRERINQIDELLAEFTAAMRAKMIKNIHKKEDWKYQPFGLIKGRFFLEIEELKLALDFEGIEDARMECADVGNFAMIMFRRLLTEGTGREKGGLRV